MAFHFQTTNFTGIEHQPVGQTNERECTWLIVEGRRNLPVAPDGNWHLSWSGARPGDSEELSGVFVQMPARANSSRQQVRGAIKPQEFWVRCKVREA